MSKNPLSNDPLFSLINGKWVAKNPNGCKLKISESALVQEICVNTYLIRAGGIDFRYRHDSGRMFVDFLEGKSIPYTMKKVHGNVMSDTSLNNLVSSGDIVGWYRTSYGGGEYFIIEKM